MKDPLVRAEWAVRGADARWRRCAAGRAERARPVPQGRGGSGRPPPRVGAQVGRASPALLSFCGPRGNEDPGGGGPQDSHTGPPRPIADREPRAHAGLGPGPPGRGGGFLSSGAGLKARLQRSLQTPLASLPPEPLAGVGLAVGGRGEPLSDDPGRPREPLPPAGPGLGLPLNGLFAWSDRLRADPSPRNRWPRRRARRQMHPPEGPFAPPPLFPSPQGEPGAWSAADVPPATAGASVGRQLGAARPPAATARLIIARSALTGNPPPVIAPRRRPPD